MCILCTGTVMNIVNKVVSALEFHSLVEETKSQTKKCQYSGKQWEDIQSSHTARVKGREAAKPRRSTTQPRRPERAVALALPTHHTMSSSLEETAVSTTSGPQHLTQCKIVHAVCISWLPIQCLSTDLVSCLESTHTAAPEQSGYQIIQTPC